MRGGRFTLGLCTALWLCACSALVDPGVDDVRCVARSGSTDPCSELGSNMVCRDGKCEVCEPGAIPEDCNRLDDDCDGIIDEGNDQDGDGFTWCGGGIRVLADCVDTDPGIHPVGERPDSMSEHRDTCGDGIDNDCSGIPDDDPMCGVPDNCQDVDTMCPAGGSCITCPEGQQCQLCPSDLNCGARQTICVTPLKPGSTCNSDFDCQSGICVEAAAIGADSELGKLCSRACCTDSDCSDDNICLVRGNGTRLCVPPGLVGRVSARQDQQCTNNMECSSGSCDPVIAGSDVTICRRMCTSDVDCVGAPHGSACLFQPTMGFVAPGSFACGPPPADDGLDTGAVCIPNANRCKSGLCIPSPIYLGTCNESCRTSCNLIGSTCAYESLSDVLPELTPRLPLCVPAQGGVALGQTCADSSDCAQGRCVQERCSNTCCNDSDCPGEHCRPISTAEGYGMYCAR